MNITKSYGRLLWREVITFGTVDKGLSKIGTVTKTNEQKQKSATKRLEKHHQILERQIR